MRTFVLLERHGLARTQALVDRSTSPTSGAHCSWQPVAALRLVLLRREEILAVSVGELAAATA